MPAKSKKQRRLFAIAEHNPDASPEAKKLAGSVSHKALHDVASTKEKNLPITVKSHKRHAPKKKEPEKKPPRLKYGN
jgi:hypothetical protein